MPGRPTLLWQLAQGDQVLMDCLAEEIENEHVLVRVLEHGVLKQSSAFDNATAAVRWALNLEADLMAAGWLKRI